MMRPVKTRFPGTEPVTSSQSGYGAIAAIILAAGKNTRFDTGIPKSLQTAGNQTLLERQIRQYHDAGIKHVAVVVGYRGDQIAQAVENWNRHLKFPVSIVWNHQYERANAYSIIAARDWVKTLLRRTESNGKNQKTFRKPAEGQPEQPSKVKNYWQAELTRHTETSDVMESTQASQYTHKTEPSSSAEITERNSPSRPKPYFLCTMADHMFSDDFFTEVTSRFESYRQEPQHSEHRAHESYRQEPQHSEHRAHESYRQEPQHSEHHPAPTSLSTLYLAVDQPGPHNVHIDLDDVTKVAVEGAQKSFANRYLVTSKTSDQNKETENTPTPNLRGSENTLAGSIPELFPETGAQTNTKSAAHRNPGTTISSQHKDNLPKPEVTGRLISRIGKKLDQYSHYDTGCFLLHDEIFDAIDQAISLQGDSISHAVQWLAARHQAAVIDTTGLLWSDIDTPEDYALSVHLHR
jgi:choline kinase